MSECVCKSNMHPACLIALLAAERQAGREEQDRKWEAKGYYAGAQRLLEERDEGIRELRRKLALAGVEGSPPVGETTIGALLRRASTAEARVKVLEAWQSEVTAALAPQDLGLAYADAAARARFLQAQVAALKKSLAREREAAFARETTIKNMAAVAAHDAEERDRLRDLALLYISSIQAWDSGEGSLTKREWVNVLGVILDRSRAALAAPPAASPEVNVERAQLFVDGNCGVALLGVDLQEGWSEFVPIQQRDDELSSAAERRACYAALQSLRKRLSKPDLSYVWQSPKPPAASPEGGEPR